MDVTRWNFAEAFKTMQDAARGALFVAFDFEFTGLRASKYHEAQYFGMQQPLTRTSTNTHPVLNHTHTQIHWRNAMHVHAMLVNQASIHKRCVYC